ncbi:MAG: PIN domain-containing protein [Comamonadaceae bacterium]|nr:MAG: PIN domain-containing protein [Comamonadaceae bacterium]
MWLALSGRFRARWTALIHEEWVRNLLKNRPELGPDPLRRTVALMNKAVPDALATGYESLICGLDLPDPDDRHVLAAAIRCNAGVIVTFNERGFPAEVVSAFGIEIQHPDEFIDNLFDLDQAAVVAAARKQRCTLKTPPIDVDRYLDILLRQGLSRTVRDLTGFRTLL